MTLDLREANSKSWKKGSNGQNSRCVSIHVWVYACVCVSTCVSILKNEVIFRFIFYLFEKQSNRKNERRWEREFFYPAGRSLHGCSSWDWAQRKSGWSMSHSGFPCVWGKDSAAASGSWTERRIGNGAAGVCPAAPARDAGIADSSLLLLCHNVRPLSPLS